MGNKHKFAFKNPINDINSFRKQRTIINLWNWNLFFQLYFGFLNMKKTLQIFMLFFFTNQIHDDFHESKSQNKEKKKLVPKFKSPSLKNLNWEFFDLERDKYLELNELEIVHLNVGKFEILCHLALKMSSEIEIDHHHSKTSVRNLLLFRVKNVKGISIKKEFNLIVHWTAHKINTN